MKDKNKKDKFERLENALLEFIEREANEPSCEEALKILPEMAHTLIALWAINHP